MRTDSSAALFARAQQLLPGGVNSPVRAFRAVGGTPRFLVRGEGARVIDADGNTYIDYLGSWGPLILGHAPPAVVEAVSAAAREGTSFGAPHPREVELAELVVEAVPSVEMVRFVNSGTEATMSAIRLARAYTGRDMIVKFDGCYHGHADGLLVKAGSGPLSFGSPDSPGVPAGMAQHTLSVRYNDLAAVEAAFAAHPDRIAAVIVEPIAGNMGLVPPRAGFLAGLRALTQRYGALLIFDEVITGFRVAYGGAQALYGVYPDLTCLGKVLGGGLPVGAYGGRREIMAQVAPAGPVYQAGTLAGNPLAMAAGCATLRLLRAGDAYRRLEALAQPLATGLAEAAAAAGLPVQVARVGSLLTVFFTDSPVTDYESARRADTARYARFFHAMLARGVYLPPSQFEVWCVSLAHTEADIAATLAAARAAFAEVAAAG
ncbi:MAG TPA: glutamate-1-semialdehyde 2,1-aminomutase [Chloroflexota bacterium]|nr:glutamate-1-semialdehyde 2,1-aminomutase [Chloroflexota bacterium]HZU07763.1 glutamate-1-semialdehyde 2,1-aminomutase [Chloroflexota bacterium]